MKQQLTVASRVLAVWRFQVASSAVLLNKYWALLTKTNKQVGGGGITKSNTTL